MVIINNDRAEDFLLRRSEADFILYAIQRFDNLGLVEDKDREMFEKIENDLIEFIEWTKPYNKNDFLW